MSMDVVGDVTSEGPGTSTPSVSGHKFHQITVGGSHNPDPG